MTEEFTSQNHSQENHVSVQLVNIDEMSRILNVPKSWIYQRTRTGSIPCVRIGKYVRFNIDEVIAFLKGGENGTR